MLSIQGLSIAYRTARIFEDFSLSLAGGEFVVVLGRNGAGKSTLLKALAGDFAINGFPNRQCGGALFLNGQAVRDMPARRLAQLRAVLAQSVPNTFPVSAADIVRLGRYPHLESAAPAQSVDAIVREMLELAGVAHLAARDVTTLSGGEFARVQFARTLAQLWSPADCGEARETPRFLLLDEPTAALDLVHQHRLFSTVKQLTRTWGIGALAIAHDCNLAAHYADRVVLIAEGKIVADGPPQEAMQAALMEECYGVPMRAIANDARHVPFFLPDPDALAAR